MADLAIADPDADDFLAEFGCLIAAAYGLDRDWIIDGACVRYMVSSPDNVLNPWIADWWKMYQGIRGRELVRAALIICHDCPAQYNCARYAVKGQMKAGTWSMALVDLKWLQDEEEDPMEIIDSAEANGLAMQDVMVDIRPR